MFYKNHENITALLDFFEEAILENPEKLLVQIDGELMSNYVHEGNNQQGRSIVQASALEGVAAGLEAVRAVCVEAIRAKDAGKTVKMSQISKECVK
jgi:hypothetical protein